LKLDGPSTIWWIFLADMSRLKGWLVNGTGSGSRTLVDFCICGAKCFGWSHDMRSKTETKQHFGKRSACCQWQLSKAETESKMCVGLVGELYTFSTSALAAQLTAQVLFPWRNCFWCPWDTRLFGSHSMPGCDDRKQNSCPCHEWNPSQRLYRERASDQKKCRH
jgi:hypothetical protein